MYNRECGTEIDKEAVTDEERTRISMGYQRARFPGLGHGPVSEWIRWSGLGWYGEGLANQMIKISHPLLSIR